jgi:hypothetical protein
MRPSVGPNRLYRGCNPHPPCQTGNACDPSAPVPSYARCADSNVRTSPVPSFLYPSGEHHLRPLGLLGCSNVLRKRQNLRSRCIRTCCGTPAVSNWQTMVQLRVPSRHTLDTRIFSTRCAIRNSHQRGSKVFGKIRHPGTARCFHQEARKRQYGTRGVPLEKPSFFMQKPVELCT